MTSVMVWYQNIKHNGFFGCGHFSKANEFLYEHGMDPIDWNAVNHPDTPAPEL